MERLITEKVKVIPEGRKGIYLVESEEICGHIEQANVERIHSFRGDMPVLIGADWDKADVIDFLKGCDTIAFVFPHQALHAIAAIKGYDRVLFDVGEVDERLMDTKERDPDAP